MEKAESMQEVVSLVKSSNSSFSIIDLDSENASFDTREHGDMQNSKAGKEDILQARTLRGIVKTKFSNVNTNIETIDEWVLLIFKLAL